MTLTTENRWAAAGAIAASALLLFIAPLGIDKSVVDLFMKKDGKSKDYQRLHRLAGLFIHVLLLFFVTFGILCADFACQ